MSVEANERLVRRYINEVWNKGNLALIKEVWMPERAMDCREVWVRNRRAHAGGAFTIDDLVAQDDRVVVRWSYRHAGEANPSRNGAPAATGPAALTGISIWYIENGRFMENHFESEGSGLYE
jgi:predicted ester cyclase